MPGCHYVKRRLTTELSVVGLFVCHTPTKRRICWLLFSFLQIEERAIQDLLLHYQAHDNPDELIVVERSSAGPMAAPTWHKHWGWVMWRRNMPSDWEPRLWLSILTVYHIQLQALLLCSVAFIYLFAKFKREKELQSQREKFRAPL